MAAAGSLGRKAGGYRRWVVAVVVIALALASLVAAPDRGRAQEADPQALASVTSATIRVEAYVDGRSQLVLQGSTARWHHFDFAAPGRHGFVNEPTIINGTPWFPSWPDEPNAENRFCNCYSDTFTGVAPAVPEIAFDVTIREIEGRGLTRVVQQPIASNGYALSIEFDDNLPPGPAWYVVEFDVPTPQGVVNELQREIRSLQSNGSLNQGQSRALNVKLEGMVAKLESANTTAACHQLRAFDNNVHAFVQGPVLTASEALPLREGSETLATLAGCS